MKGRKTDEQKEDGLLSSLCQVLRKNGDKILQGDGKLSLTTQSLGMLGSSFRRLSDTESMGLASATSSFSRTNNHSASWKKDMEYLRDFISRISALKIMHGSNTMQGAIQVDRFRSLKVIEVKKVPIHMIEGLQVLRGQLTTIIISRSLEHLQDLFETCGGDMSAPMSWPHLYSACVSFNSLESLDGSLRLLPSLVILDISHNQLQKTDKNLEYLTELERLNLGYNCLDTIPTFSLSCKAKLKTLVIKNNNLDNIEGVNELTSLEELDISSNCIVDHGCLKPLSSLGNLQRLNTEGNPLSYHKNHRKLTVGCLAWQAVSLQFELDAKKLSSSETVGVRQKPQRAGISRRPSALAHSVIVHSDQNRDSSDRSDLNISGEYSFQDSEVIATSLPVGVSKKKSRRRNKRAQDISDSSATELSSPEGSLSSTPVKGSTLSDIVHTRQKVELLRSHYGPNWLQVMHAQFNNDSGLDEPRQSDATNSDTSASGVSEKVPSFDTTIVDRPKEKGMKPTTASSQNIPTEDDLYLNDPVVSSGVPKSLDTGVTKKLDSAPGKENGVKVIETAAQMSVESLGFEWSRTEEEELDTYGEESEPFIVFLKQRRNEQLLVTLNQRYLVEKNLNGIITEKLDLKSILSVEQFEEEMNFEEFDEKVTLPHIKLTFDYVRRDRRERIYAMENEENSEKMCDLLQPFLDDREMRSQPKFVNQCLKCSHIFSREQGIPLNKNKPFPQAGSKKDLLAFQSQMSVMYQCPKCKSDHVIQVEKDKRPSSETTTPVGSYSSAPGSYVSPVKGHSRSSSQDFTSPLARSTPHKPPTGDRDPALGTTVRRNLYPENSNSLTDYGARRRSNAFIKTDSSDRTRTGSDSLESRSADNNTFRRESCPNIGRDLQYRPRISSQESDITILTNPSEGSIAVISESSSETLSALSPDDTIRQVPRGDYARDDTIIRSSSVPQKLCVIQNGNHSGDDKGEVTPLGSPLSNSICNSMVSSIYQNSGLVEQNLSNTPKGCDILKPSEINDELSIYDSGIASSLPNEKVQCIKDELSGLSDKESINVIISEDDAGSQLMDDEQEVVTRERSSAIYEHPFTDVDHHLKLYLMMNLFDDTEEFECILKCDVCQYLVDEIFPAFLILTSTKFYILKIDPEASSEKVSDWLAVLDIQPITELHHVDLGLGSQTFRLEFDTECSCYTFIVRDSGQCTSFVEFMTELLNKNVLTLNKKMQVKYHHSPSEQTLQDLEKEVICRNSEDDQKLVLYLLGYIVRGGKPRYPVSFVLTDEALCLVKENFQWPQPRLQAPLDAASIAKHFTVLERQLINNIATVEVDEKEKTRMKLSFFDELTGLMIEWKITMETANSIQSFIDGIRHPWEEVFGVELDVSMVDLSDTEEGDVD